MAKGQVSELALRSDHRGWLVELLGQEQVNSDEFGLVYAFAAVPQAVRGNHYHVRKTEWFCVIRGTGRLVLEDANTGDREEIALDGKTMVRVRIPPLAAHAIQNTGDSEMIVLAYISEPFDPEDPDTFAKEIIRIGS